MTPELIAAVVSVLCAAAAWLKTHADIARVKADRALVKADRDRDSKELHDKVLKLEFLCNSNKDTIGLLMQQVADANKQVNTLTTQIAEVLVKLDAMQDSLDDLKKDLRNGRGD